MTSARSCWGKRNASLAYAQARTAYQSEANLNRELEELEASVQEMARDAKRAQISVATAVELCQTKCQRGHVSFVEALHLLKEGWRRLHSGEQLLRGGGALFVLPVLWALFVLPVLWFSVRAFSVRSLTHCGVSLLSY